MIHVLSNAYVMIDVGVIMKSSYKEYLQCPNSVISAEAKVGPNYATADQHCSIKSL